MSNPETPAFSALDLTTNLSPGNPTQGERRIYVGTDGTIKQRDSSGTETAIGGGLSATDQSYLDYLSGRWEQVAERFLLSKVPGLTGFDSIKFGPYPLGGAAGIAGNELGIDGAWSTSPNGNATWQSHSAAFITKAKTVLWGAQWRAKFALPVAARIARVGLGNSFPNPARSITFGTDGTTDATHYVFTTATGTLVTSVLADTNAHEFAITSDLTNLTLWIDGVSAGTRPCAALTDENLYDGVANTNINDAAATRVTFGYVQV